MKARRTEILLWVALCIGIWAWLARELLTIVVCIIATVPYSVYLARRWRNARVLS